MRPSRFALFSLLPLFAACQVWSPKPVDLHGATRQQGELSRQGNGLVFTPCNEQRRFSIEDSGNTGLVRDAAELFKDGGKTLFADLGGSFSGSTASGTDGTLDVSRVYRLQHEGHGCDDQKTPENGATLKGYADAGGRILFDHMHFRWFVKAIEEWEQIGEFDTGDDFPPDTSFTVETGFPKGAAFSKWLVNVGASKAPGQLVIAKAQKSAKVANAPIAQPWVSGTGAIQYMSVNTPVEMAAMPENQCGRFIHTDLHVAGNSMSSSDQGTPFPGGCDNGELTPEEKALAFMIFDLSNCVMQEDQEPKPPVVVK